MFSRPPRREKSALGTFPPVEPILALQGREGQPRISLDRAVERECQARIFSRPPGREKSALGTLSRSGGRERVPGADLLSTARPREIRAWHSLSTAMPREIRAWHSLSTSTPTEIRAWPLSPCRANVGSTGERGPAADFSRPPRRQKSALTHSSPCRANVAKNFQSPKSKKKKSSHKVTLVRKLSSRATFLSHRQDKVRAGPYPGFFLSKKLHMQIDLGTKRRVSRRRIFWSQGIYEVTKGQAWACVLEFGTPPGSGIWTLLKLFPSPVRAQNFSPPALKLPPGYPWEALPERVRNRHFERLWRTRVWCARRHIWRADSPSGELGGARVSLHKLSRQPLHVSPNIEFSRLPSPPGVRTP